MTSVDLTVEENMNISGEDENQTPRSRSVSPRKPSKSASSVFGNIWAAKKSAAKANSLKRELAMLNLQ